MLAVVIERAYAGRVESQALTCERHQLRPRHLLSLSDIDAADLHWIVRRGAMHAESTANRTLESYVIGTHFAAESTRTRTAFTAGAMRLGAAVVAYGPRDLQLNTGETFEDTGRVLASMIDALVVRMPADDEALRALAADDMGRD